MTTVPPGDHIADVQDGLELRHVRPRDLRGQDVNAQVLTPELEEALHRNVAERGALESVPFAALTSRGLEIVSGHHRVAAAIAADLETIPVLVDTTDLDRSSIAAKQIAHNAIIGEADPQVLAIIAAEIRRSDALMESAITSLKLPPLPAPDLPDTPPSIYLRPQYETLMIAMLRPELRDFTDLLAEIEAADPSDLVVLAAEDTWTAFRDVLTASGLRVRAYQTTSQLAWLVAQGVAALNKPVDDVPRSE